MRFLTVFIVLLVTGLTNLQAQIVTWRGITWRNLYLSDSIAVVDDNLQVSTGDASVGYYGGAWYTTPPDFQSSPGVWAEAKFLDTGTTPGPQLNVWSLIGPTYKIIAIGTYHSQNRYYVYWAQREGGNKVVYEIVDIGPRSPGEHTVKIAKQPDDVVEFWLDGTQVYTLTPDTFSMPTFPNINLVANGTAQGQMATFTDYQAGTEEDSVTFRQRVY